MSDTNGPGNGLASDADALVSGLIHELRHPLLGIKAGLQLLALQAGVAITARDEWQMIAAQLARMEELCRTYQDLFRPDRAATVFEPERVVRRSVDLLRHRLGRLGARFKYEPGPPGVFAQGAPQAVFHAVTNLVLNAVDAVEEAGGQKRVEVRFLPLASEARFVEVRVSDEGTGIPAEIRERIFLPRFTTKPEGKGTGFGLHVARTALTASGGELVLVPDDDPARAPWARTEFAVRVPAQKEAP
jgi:signal transduction histidine kinase